jgi:formate/nitrite transporter FocA (FNT family)
MFSPSAIQRQRFQKVTLIFLFLLLSVALIITWNTPATGYESSIYRSTPLILWVSLIASVIVGIALVVVSIAKNELDRSSLWKIGFLLVFLCYTICLALFIIRGYYMWCMTGDPASHIGWIKETINTGHIAGGVIYPVIHIYLSLRSSFLTGLDLSCFT